MFTIGASSSQYTHQLSAPSLETYTAPDIPASQGAMTHESHLLVSELHHAIRESASALDKVTDKLNELMVELHSLRKESFEYVNKGTTSVTGAVKKSQNSNPKEYFEKLTEFNALKANIKEIIDSNHLMGTSSLPEPCPGSALYGDILALNERRPVPDFQYNIGYLQFNRYR